MEPLPPTALPPIAGPPTAGPPTGWTRPGADEPPPTIIDCDVCVARETAACDDCVVTFLCSREPDEAVVIDVVEARALRMLGEAGLVPRLRHRRRTG